MKTFALLSATEIGTNGTADSTPKISFVEQQFTTPTDILVQVVLTSNFFNPQTTSFWKAELTVDSWEDVENGKKVVHTVPQFSVMGSLLILKCTWVKVRLTAQNGGGTGLMNIYV